MERIIKFLSGFRLASALLLLLLILTWLGTLEQVEHGLYQTIQKYFTWKSFIVIPDITINGKLLPIPLPGANWVGALLFINMFLGGIIRIRKNWKKAGVIIAHFGIIFLLVSGAVTQLFSQRGNMALYEGETSDYAQAYHNHAIEISELNAEGAVKKVHIIDSDIISKVQKSGREGRSVNFEGLPFSFQVSHYLKNCRPRRVGPIAAGDTPTVDGYALFKVAVNKADEANLNGCYVKTSNGQELLLFSGAYEPYTLEIDGAQYAVSLKKAIWKMPFQIKLDDFNAEFFPTGKPKKFESFVQRIEGGLSENVRIYMNHPMRYKGYTFYQAKQGMALLNL